MAVKDDMIECKLCGKREHVIQKHLSAEHPEVSLDEYKERFPDAPILSPKAIEILAKRKQENGTAGTATPTNSVPEVPFMKLDRRALNVVFDLGRARAAMGQNNNPIPITTYDPDDELKIYVEEVDPQYAFNIDLLKTVMMGIESNMPVYLWGHAGTGKSTIFEQIAARTRHPFIRVQHTGNTEESEVVGQWTVKDGQTVFELGPLAFAMKHGLIYLADEYDFAMPAITALYQPVLEGKALIIKGADKENRIIHPHPMFRMVATGNTNGTGDESGLYQGTLIQNAANYERFGIVEQVHYMDAKTETQIIQSKHGVTEEDAKKMVSFAGMIREAFGNGKIGLPVSPRAILNAAKNGNMRRSYRKGLELSYLNRLSSTDKMAAIEILDRLSIT